MIRLLHVRSIRNKSIYEHLKVSENVTTDEIWSKIETISADGGVINAEMAKEIKRFQTDRFNYDVIIQLEKKQSLHSVEFDQLPSYLNPDTEQRIVNRGEM